MLFRLGIHLRVALSDTVQGIGRIAIRNSGSTRGRVQNVEDELGALLRIALGRNGLVNDRRNNMILHMKLGHGKTRVLLDTFEDTLPVVVAAVGEGVGNLIFRRLVPNRSRLFRLVNRERSR